MKLRRDEAAKPSTSEELCELLERLSTGGNEAPHSSDSSDYEQWNAGEIMFMCIESLNKISEPCKGLFNYYVLRFSGFQTKPFLLPPINVRNL